MNHPFLCSALPCYPVRVPVSRTVTMDFREEYEAERTRWLRNRFLWYSGVLASFFIITFAIESMAIAIGVRHVPGAGEVLLEAARSMPQAIIFVAAYLYVLRRPLTRQQLLWLVFWLTVITGTIAVVGPPAVARLRASAEEFSPSAVRSAALARLFGVHFIACLFIPWTPREALRPLYPLLGVLALTTILIGGGTLLGQIVFILLAPAVGVPGWLICWWRHSRFRDRFHYRMLRGRYGELQRELLDARAVHEGLFPQQITDGAIRFYYCYEPMRQIGGDYLYACLTTGLSENASDRLNVVILDVTGHGVKAALTVNRLYGELERLFAERPDISPGEVLQSLNRYVTLTLAKHSIYATALCMRFNTDEDLIEWANAGHPPGFLRDAAGRIERLESTAPLLGVFQNGDFTSDQESRRFGPGDAVVAYTDGVIDAVNQSGERLQIAGIQKILALHPPPPDYPGRWCQIILDEIDAHRFGASIDDTLVVAVLRPVGTADER